MRASGLANSIEKTTPERFSAAPMATTYGAAGAATGPHSLQWGMEAKMASRSAALSRMSRRTSRGLVNASWFLITRKLEILMTSSEVGLSWCSLVGCSEVSTAQDVRRFTMKSTTEDSLKNIPMIINSTNQSSMYILYLYRNVFFPTKYREVAVGAAAICLISDRKSTVPPPLIAALAAGWGGDIGPTLHDVLRSLKLEVCQPRATLWWLSWCFVGQE
jgi:hypothetical protein